LINVSLLKWKLRNLVRDAPQKYVERYLRYLRYLRVKIIFNVLKNHILEAIWRICGRHCRRITKTFSTSTGDFVFVQLQSVPRPYDWPSAIENNGAVGESRYKGNQARLGPRSLSYSRCPAAKTATADNIVPECLGHFQTHWTMLLAYVNANFVRDKVTLVYMLIRSRGRDGGRATLPFRDSF